MAVEPEIVVVGSINLDLSVSVERFPEPGETVLGGSVMHGGGGKGANQAVGAARLGRRVMMVGRVGDDTGGAGLVAALERDLIDVSAIGVSEGSASGLAIIEVDPAGENRIVVAPGANALVSVEDLAAVADVVSRAPVVLTQLEIPTQVVRELATRPRSGLLVVNPAPASADFDPAGVDVLVPNRGELARLVAGNDDAEDVGVEAADTVDEVVDQVRALAASTPDLDAVVVTLGSDGSVVLDGLRSGRFEPVIVPAIQVDAVDTTAAGDSFCAGLADALCLGAEVAEAAGWATRVAAVTVTRRGAQASLPRRSEVLA